MPVLPMFCYSLYHSACFSVLKLESPCLARYKDGVWYPATVVDVLDGAGGFKVMFDKYDDAEQVDIEDVVPLGKHLSSLKNIFF